MLSISNKMRQRTTLDELIKTCSVNLHEYTYLNGQYVQFGHYIQCPGIIENTRAL